MGDLSLNFSKNEFACPCCGKNDISPTLVAKLQILRNRVGEPINVTSGVRCKAYNKKIDGVNNSPHIPYSVIMNGISRCIGRAADIQVAGIPPYILANIAENIGNMRIGIYPNHLHLDVVPPNPSKFWLVKKYGGEYIYSKKEKSLSTFLKNNL